MFVSKVLCLGFLIDVVVGAGQDRRFYYSGAELVEVKILWRLRNHVEHIEALFFTSLN